MKVTNDDGGDLVRPGETGGGGSELGSGGHPELVRAVRYGITVNFTADRPLTADEVDALVDALAFLVEEPGTVYDSGEWVRAEFGTRDIRTEVVGVADILPDDNARCKCGNTADSDGFYPCDSDGLDVEPVGDWDGLYSCGRCGHLYRFGTEVIG